MSQKAEIISLLRTNGAMTQKELAAAIYGDNLHGSNIYTALMKLTEGNFVIRSGSHPAKYSLGAAALSEAASAVSQTGSSETQRNTVQQSISEEHAVRLILDYYNESQKEEHGRYLSWSHCYKAFSENRTRTDEQTVDYLALHLAFYLASWGMYRGSSFLLQKDYKIHIPIVKLIQEEKYNPLHGISAEHLCEESNLSLLEEISSEIKTRYAEEAPSFDGTVNHATDTLITKILLGTLGCVPAFDRYYIDSVKKHRISGGTYNRKSVLCIAKFYCAHLDVFEPLRHKLSQCGTEYPPMKLMDMCFWQDAYINDMNRL